MFARGRFSRTSSLIVAIFLLFKVDLSEHSPHNSGNAISSSRTRDLIQESSTADKSSSSNGKPSIEASIIPIVKGGGNSNGHQSRVHSNAEVRLLVPFRHQQNSEKEAFIRATSIVMEFNEDPRSYLRPIENTEGKHHRLRHGSRKNYDRAPQLQDASNDAPLDAALKNRDTILTSTVKPESKVQTRILTIGNHVGSLHPRKISDININRLHPFQNETWIAFHSPKRIFIPVRYGGKNTLSLIPANGVCLQCASNLTVIAMRGESTVEVPVPDISICPRLARTPGRINLAVTSGPRPGLRVREGKYPVELIVWKRRGRVFACQYMLTVIVRKCEAVISPVDGSVECSEGTTWGSKCHFSCFSGHVLQGHRTVTCEGDGRKVHWSSAFPHCKKIPPSFATASIKLPCLKPEKPHNGALVCDSNGKDVYPDGSVCQFFCYLGFLIEHISHTNTLIVCKNGQWTPNKQVSCMAAYCSEPRIPNRSTLRCDTLDNKDNLFKSKYKNGTKCHYRCDVGTTIPRSQRHMNSILCTAPHWNDSSIPDCKQKIGPRPHNNDCRDVEEVVNRKGLANLKPTRFVIKHNATKIVVYGNCTHVGKVGIGTYRNNCTVYDPELNVTASCSYSVVVKERSCQAPTIISNASIQCDNKIEGSYPPKTQCKYICSDGFIIPKSETKRRSIKCHRNLIWKPIDVPTCKKVIPPVPKKGQCVSQKLYVERNDTTVIIKKARFKSSLKGSSVKVRCSLNNTLAVGNYTNHCEATDRELGSTSSCKYNVTVLARGCEVLIAENYGSVICSKEENNSILPVGTICTFTCDNNHTIPTDQLHHSRKFCQVNGKWNSTENPVCVSRGCEALNAVQFGSIICSKEEIDSLLPIGTTCSFICDEGYTITTSQLTFSNKTCQVTGNWNTKIQPVCVKKEAPIPIQDSCIDRSLVHEDISRFRVPISEFESTSGAALNITCIPEYISNYGVHSISCTAYDPQFRISSSCFFKLELQSPVDVAELDREEVMCISLPIVTHGNVKCNSSGNGSFYANTVCKVMCDDGYVIPKSQRHLSVSACLFESEWNTTEVPDCVKATAPVGIPGCINQIINATNLEDVVVPIPSFLTTKNSSATVNCAPKSLISFGVTEVQCIAEDEELETSILCSYNLSIVDVTKENVVSTASSLDFTVSSITTTTSPWLPCQPLILPHHGNSNCSTKEDGREVCQFWCDKGYAFSTTYMELFISRKIECDGTDGLWDFHRMYNTSHLPECLDVLPNTTVEVWISFKASVDECDSIIQPSLENEIQKLLINLNEEMCRIIDCNAAIMVNCSEAENSSVVQVFWTIATAFNPLDFEDNDEVPEVEKQLEVILETTKNAIKDDKEFFMELMKLDMQLLQESFNKGLIDLSCHKRGYAADLYTDKCVECPSGSREVEGQCVTCPTGSFQILPGQTFCERCPLDPASRFKEGTVPITCSG